MKDNETELDTEEKKLSKVEETAAALVRMGISRASPKSLNTMKLLCSDRERQLQQKVRLVNRIAAGESKRAHIDVKILKVALKHQEAMLKFIEDAASECVEDHPVWPWLKEVRGIGPILAAELLAPIDFSKARHCSSLWKFCGLAVNQITDKEGVTVDVADRRIKGQPLEYNMSLKVLLLGKISAQFLKLNTMYMPGGKKAGQHDPQYVRFYAQERKKLASIRPDQNDLHHHRKAVRKMMKIFVSHLWDVGRRAYDLSTDRPWIVASAHGGHDENSYISVEEIFPKFDVASLRNNHPAAKRTSVI